MRLCNRTVSSGRHSLAPALFSSLLVCTSANSGPALADGTICQQHLEPAQVSLTESAVDSPRSACTRSSGEALARGIAAIDTEDFYGTIAGSLFVRGRMLLGSGLEVELGARLLDVRFAQNAVLTDTETSLGPISIGLARSERVGWFGLRGRAAAQLRLELPRTNGGLDVTALTALPAIVWSSQLNERWRLHTRAALLLWSARVSRGVDTRYAALLGTDATTRLRRAVGVAVGIEGQSGWYRATLDHILVRASISYGVDTKISLALGAPFFGEERANAIVSLGVGSTY